MEEIYVNVEKNKSVASRPSTNQTGPRSSERRFHGTVVLCLGLLSVFLLAGLIGLGVHYQTCPAGWKMFGCSCYLLSSERRSWSTGRQDCRERGAHLVVINSPKEQKFSSTITKVETEIWIGLTDRETEGTWKWIEGRPLTLSYWETDEPNNGGEDSQGGEEDCAHIRTGKKTVENWNDVPCGTSLHWICEKNVDV
ncbi:C-type lectin domain family 4 member E-like [Scomber scombrus]|uniref:C-type lectin domain family 4 member E-like n=1 Tax=Scomber scombrus TaxID=13677 RepID=UPI002DDC04B0|nr:C-type lectin domain family 4 member E-like [Scomber scombrus]